MPLMPSIRRNKSPYRNNDSPVMLSPIESGSSSSSFAYTAGNDDSDVELSSDVPQSQRSQINKLKKVFKRNPRQADSNDKISVSYHSLASSIGGDEVSRIAIDEDSVHEDSSVPFSPRWQRTVGAVEKPPSVRKLDSFLQDSYSESEDEEHSSRRSTVRTSVDADMDDLDDSTHPIPALAPPSLSDLTTASSTMNKSTKSFGTASTATTMQMSELSFRSGKPRSSFVSSGDSYSQLSAANSSKGFKKPGSSRTNLGHKEDSFTSRASTIRSAVEQAMDESTHALPPPPTIAEGSTSTSSRQRSDVALSLDGDSTHALLIHEPPTLLPSEESSIESNQIRGTSNSRKGRKSRSPRPSAIARDTSSRSKPRSSPSKFRSGNSKSPASNRSRSSKSPLKGSDPAILQQIIRPEFDTSSPSLRGERKSMDDTSQRGLRFTVRRTVSSPVQPQVRKQLRPTPEERSERMRRSITFGTLEQSPSSPSRRSAAQMSSRNEESKGHRGLSPLRGSLMGRSSSEGSNMKAVMSERGIRSIDTRDFPGVPVNQTTAGRRISFTSERGVRSIDTRDFPGVPVNQTTTGRRISFTSERGVRSIDTRDFPGVPVNQGTQRTTARSASPGLLRNSFMSERGVRSIDTRDFPGVPVNQAQRTTGRSASPGLFRNSSRQTRTTPIDKRKSHSTRAERSIPVDIDSDEETKLKTESKTFHGRQSFSFDTDSGDDEVGPLGQVSPVKSRHLRRSGSEGGIRRSGFEGGIESSPSERGFRTLGRRHSTGLRMDMTGITTSPRSSSPGPRLFGNSVRQTRTVPIDKRKSHSTRAERTISIEDMDSGERNTSIGAKVKDKIKNLKDKSTSLRGRRSIDVEVNEEKPDTDSDSGERSNLGTKVKDKIKRLKDRSLSLRAKRSIDVEVGEESSELVSTSSRCERSSISMELDEEKPKLVKASSRRERRSIDGELDQEKPVLKSKSSCRERRSIDVEMDEEKPKLKSKSSRRERRSIDTDLDGEKPKLKSKSSRRERRSMDVDLDEEKPKIKSKSSRRERRSIDLELGEEKGKKSKSSRRERRALSIDLDLGSEKRKEKSKKSRRTVSVDSGDSLDFESKQPKAERSLLTESLEDTAETPAREPRSRSRKKDSPKKKSKSPKGKTSSKISGDGNETSYSTFADAGEISVDHEGEIATKSRPSSPSSLFKKLKGIRSERSPRKEAGRSHSPKRSPVPSKTRKLRLSIS